MRTIHTGSERPEYTPIGHSTSLAARMQTLAPIGSIAVTAQTQKLCEGYFAFNALGPTTVKGVSEPVQVYEVTGLGPLRTRLQRAVGRGLTKFVGRQPELEQMRRALDQARQGHGQIVAAVGEAGVGKSRLLYEFKAVSQSSTLVLEAYSVSHGKASAYLPVIELLKEYSLAQMDPRIRRHRTQEALKRIFLRESLNQTLVLVFEDLHWIDGETQALLDLLVATIASARILLLLNYRPEYRHEWGSRTYYTQLRLDSLGKEIAGEMLSALLETSPAPAALSAGASGERSVGDTHVADRVREQAELAALKRTVAEKTEGNPFFIEELVQALFDEGVLVRDGAIKLARPFSDSRLPPTVQGVLASRIDRLPADEKELLQVLAVIGREFPLTLVSTLVRRSEAELDSMLADLQLAEFIYEQPATGDIQYIFKHALTQEVAYNSLLIERRKLLHERAGQALESMFAEQLDDHVAELAYHYRRTDNSDKAVEYLGRAGQQAIQRSAYADAISNLSTAIDLLQRLPESPERIRRELLLQLAVGPALITLKGYAAPEVERAYTRARELCERSGDTPELFPALYGMWLVYWVRVELRTGYELAEELLRRAQSALDPVLLPYAEFAVGGASVLMGELLLGREHIERAIALYDPGRHRPLTSRYEGIDVKVGCSGWAAMTLWHLGYPDQAFKRANEALALAQGLSHPLSLAVGQCFVGLLRQYRREIHGVQETMEVVIALCVEHGFSYWLALATILHGWALAQRGWHQEGMEQIGKGLAALRATAVELAVPYVLCLLAEAFMETGRLVEGLGALAQALAAVNEHEERFYEAEIHRLKGELLLRQDHSKIAEAQSCFQRAIEIARNQSAKSLELRATMSVARLLAKQDHRVEARTILAEIYNWFTEGFDTADLKDAKALLDELREDR